MIKMTSLRIIATLLIAAGLSSVVVGQGLSPEQIARFSSMSPADQQRLAKQYGVDIPRSRGEQQQSKELPQTIEKPTDGYARKYEPKKQGDDDALPLFGYDVFAGQPTSFTPIADLPVPSDYIVGPGDELSIQLYGKENEHYRLPVGRDGFINMPKLGPISVAGKSFKQVRDDLTLRIKKQIIGADAAIAMGELRLMQVYVLGDANSPGAYNLSSLATVIQAIIAAGGVAESGSLRNIEVRRGKQLVQKVDLYDLLINGDNTSDVRLRSGDAVFIRPAGNRVRVEGEVVREAIYEITPNTNLTDIVRIAGGLKPTAMHSNITIKRPADTGVKVITRSLSQSAGFTLQAGDSVAVHRKARSYAGAVTLSGAFAEGGRRGFVEGMRVSDIVAADALRDDADTELALLVSSDNGEHTHVRYVELAKVLVNPEHSTNYMLNQYDELIVLPGTGFLRCTADDLYGEKQREFDEQAIENVLNRIAAQQEEALMISARTGQPVSKNIDVAQELARQQQYAKLQKEKLALKRVHCGLRSNYNPGLAFQRDYAQLQKEGSTRLAELQDEALALISAERKALLAPLLTKLRVQANGEEFQRIVEIRGDVKFPAIYPYSHGMSVGALVQLAGGTKESTYQQQVELTRVHREGGRLQLRHSSMALDNETLAQSMLQPRDRINVFQHPDWRNDLTVELAGEVRFPGRYAIQRGETLVDVVERAGGLTEFAFPAGAVLSRESLKEKEAKELLRLRENLKQEVASLSLQKTTSMSGLGVSPVEALSAVDALSEIEALGRLVIDLPSALANEDVNNVRLDNNDYLYIPTQVDTVTVVGEVQYPSSHLFEEGLSYKDYLSKAGGVRARADKQRVYVIRANGEVVVPKNSWFGSKIREGDTVVVPIDAQYTDKLSLFASVTQILYQLGIAYDVIKD
ncbi:SLBB domain-containing protein [Litorivivens sp.]|uniref:polysaccharide biosynthesis/export family protein n=1 Tax=Litorivivens sp. TaxID=2020868 RepID=UPI0035634334